MNEAQDKLERLITRELDGEIDAAGRRELRRLLRDPAAAALYDDTAALDREIGAGLRQALGRPAVRVRLTSWHRIGRTALMAAAAGLAAILWYRPAPPAGGPGAGGKPQQAGMASWFVPSMPPGDAVEPLSTAYVRPELRVRGTEREWILIPGDQPGSIMVIEVDRVRTRAIAVHRDY